ncbi:uncharacterized protein EI90DRAFT_3021626 [Cantharellus anzutake]|uniref:uncharacterized protein n=1 Tax=Cantharellus anzutake TaxID=1750568 RepID=UPI001902C8F3|nr:uncharacterized protein EI90DRAFT_3021626 [Cantharellus anzutake]KAF8316243.1 hypothetical protein EI90DRAFT_3021626 [Cantharellus anzutake]
MECRLLSLLLNEAEAIIPPLIAKYDTTLGTYNVGLVPICTDSCIGVAIRVHFQYVIIAWTGKLYQLRAALRFKKDVVGVNFFLFGCFKLRIEIVKSWQVFKSI